MKTIKVHFECGNHLITSINGTEQEILDYYIGQTFNLGRVEDCLTKAVAVEFLRE